MSSRLWLIFSLIVSVLGLNACSKPEPLTLSTHPWIGYQSLMLAQDQGVFPNNVHLYMNQVAMDSIDRLEAGQVDAATLTLDEVLQVRARGTPLTVVLVMDVSHGADAVYARQPLESLKDLKGKRIAYEKGAVGELMLKALLSAAQLTLKEVEPLDFHVSRMEGVWRNNLADVVICYEPCTQMIENHGGVRIFDSSDIPNTIFDVLAVRTDVLDDKEAAVKALVQANFLGLDFMRQHNEAALQKLARLNGVTFRQVQMSFEGIRLPDLERNYQLLQPKGALVEVARSIKPLLHSEKVTRDELMNLVSDQYLPVRIHN